MDGGLEAPSPTRTTKGVAKVAPKKPAAVDNTAAVKSQNTIKARK